MNISQEEVQRLQSGVKQVCRTHTAVKITMSTRRPSSPSLATVDWKQNPAGLFLLTLGHREVHGSGRQWAPCNDTGPTRKDHIPHSRHGTTASWQQAHLPPRSWPAQSNATQNHSACSGSCSQCTQPPGLPGSGAQGWVPKSNHVPAHHSVAALCTSTTGSIMQPLRLYHSPARPQDQNIAETMISPAHMTPVHACNKSAALLLTRKDTRLAAHRRGCVGGQQLVDSWSRRCARCSDSIGSGRHEGVRYCTPRTSRSGARIQANHDELLSASRCHTRHDAFVVCDCRPALWPDDQQWLTGRDGLSVFD